MILKENGSFFYSVNREGLIKVVVKDDFGHILIQYEIPERFFSVLS